jgi:hypothetical protein
MTESPKAFSEFDKFAARASDLGQRSLEFYDQAATADNQPDPAPQVMKKIEDTIDLSFDD